MSSLANYRVAFTIDMLLLWSRKGGRFCLLVLVAAAMLSIAVGHNAAPAWSLPLALFLAALLGFWAAWGCLAAYRVWKEGVEIEGELHQIEERRVRRQSGGHSLNTRLHYSYTVDGVRYEGASTWGDPGRTGLLATGQTIPIRYLEEDPSVAFWHEELPVSFPPIRFDRDGSE